MLTLSCSFYTCQSLDVDVFPLKGAGGGLSAWFPLGRPFLHGHPFNGWSWGSTARGAAALTQGSVDTLCRHGPSPPAELQLVTQGGVSPFMLSTFAQSFPKGSLLRCLAPAGGLLV